MRADDFPPRVKRSAHTAVCVLPRPKSSYRPHQLHASMTPYNHITIVKNMSKDKRCYC